MRVRGCGGGGESFLAQLFSLGEEDLGQDLRGQAAYGGLGIVARLETDESLLGGCDLFRELLLLAAASPGMSGQAR